MKSFVKIVFFCSFITTAFSQAKLDTVAFNKNIKLASKLLQTNIDSGYTIIRKNLVSSFKYKYAFGCYYSHDQLCAYYALKGNSDSVLLYTSNLIKFARVLKDTSKIVNAYLTMVRAASSNSNYKVAIENCMQAQRFADASNNPVLKIRVYHNLGLVYANLDGTAEKAIYYFKQGLQLAKESKDTFNTANLSARVGGEFYDLGQHDSALKYSSQSYQLFNKIHHLRGQGVALNNLASAYSGKKDYTNSIKHYLLALQIREKLKDKNGISILYNNLSLSYYELKNYKQALYYALLNEKLTANSQDPTMLSSTQKQLKSIYAKLGNYELAYKNANSYIVHLDSLSTKSNLKTLVDLQTKYETDKKEKEIAILELQNKNSEQRILEQTKRRNIIIVSASVLFIVVSFFLLALLNRYKKTKQQQKVIQAQKLIVEEKVLELGAKQKEILDSINYASTLQNAVLPNIKEFEDNQIKFELIFQPKDIVSGDFYWLTKKDNFLFVVVADCTGHGVPGAFMSLMGISFLNEIVNESANIETDLILNTLRNKVAQALNSKQNVGFKRDGMDLVLIRINTNTLELQFSGANNFVYLCNISNMIELKGDKMPIGIQEGANDFFKQQNYQLQKGSKIIITTDGMPDQFGGAKNKKFMYKQLEKIITNNYTSSISPLKMLIKKEYISWKANNEQVDDVTCMFIEIL